MRNIILSFVFLIGGAILTNASASQQIPMQFIKEGSAGSSGTQAPHRPWYITQDDYVLTLEATPENYTLKLLDEDGVVIYSTYLPVGSTEVILPSTLSGDFELHLAPFSNTYYYMGFIIL